MAIYSEQSAGPKALGGKGLHALDISPQTAQDAQLNRRQLLAFALALLGATLGVALWLGLVYGLGEDPSRPSIRLGTGALQLTAGEGVQGEQGLEVRQPGANGLILIQGAIRPFAARDYQVLRWQIQGLKETQELRLIWATPARIRQPFDRILTPAERRAGKLRLDSDPNWEGLIVALGLAVIEPDGKLDEPLLIRSLGILPRRPALGELPGLIWTEWRRDQGWIGRSINFTDSATGEVRVRPVWPIAIWCALAALIYLFLAPPWRGFCAWTPYLVILLLGWLALDSRWQMVLLDRLKQVRALYAGLPSSERPGAGLDRPFWPFVQALRAELGPRPQRLFIVADPADYVANRIRYHLLPHNIRLLPTLDAASGIQVGDRVLLLHPQGRQVHSDGGAELSLGNRRARVLPVLSQPGLGSLVRVTGID